MPVIRALVVGIAAILLFAACTNEPDHRKADQDSQDQIYERLQTKYPVPEINDAPTRQNVVRWTEHWDDPDKISYVYVLGENGNIVGFYTAQQRPTNLCVSLTKPDRVIGGDTDVVVSAPSLDGVYRNGGGCDSWYFWTADTDAYVELVGMKLFITDQPLAVDAQPLKVQATNENS